MKPGDTHELISREGEAEYLDAGGALSVERRDYYFTRAMTALKAAEEKLALFNSASDWQISCLNCGKMWDSNYDMYCQIEQLKAEKEGKPWPPPMTDDPFG